MPVRSTSAGSRAGASAGGSSASASAYAAAITDTPGPTAAATALDHRHRAVELAHPAQPDLDVGGPAERGAASGERGGVGQVGQVTERDADRGGATEDLHHLRQDARRRGPERSLARIL